MIKKAIFFIVLLVFTGTAQADYNPNGFPLLTVTQGQVYGDVYVGGGHGHGPAKDPAYYTHNFDVPSFTSVEWARLYVGVWGGTENYCGNIDTTFTSESFPTVEIGDKVGGKSKGYYDSNSNVYGGGHGKWWVYYDVTGLVDSGTLNTVSFQTSGDFEGDAYGAVLVVVYSGGSNPRNVTYWVNEGHEAFHYESEYYDVTTTIPEYNSNTTSFGALSGNIIRADFTNVFLTAGVNPDDPFDFRFNDNPLVTTGTLDESICPSCFGDPNCPQSSIPLCKLEGFGWCDDPNNPYWYGSPTGEYFDIDIWNVTAYTGSSNSAYFHRDNDTFVSWMLSVLTAETSSGAANVVVTQNNVSFGNINKGGTAEILTSLTLTNTGDAPASIEAEFITSSGATYGLINATNVIGGSNFSIGPDEAEMSLSDEDISTSISTLAPYATVDYNAILYVPAAQVEGDYLGTVQITWS